MKKLSKNLIIAILLLASACFGQQLELFPQDSTYWIVQDTLNEGIDHWWLICSDGHSWCYGEEYSNKVIDRGNGLVEVLDFYGSGDIYRERICRRCLRHEKQIKKTWTPPPKLSEFDSLKAVIEKAQR